MLQSNRELSRWKIPYIKKYYLELYVCFAMVVSDIIILYYVEN